MSTKVRKHTGRKFSDVMKEIRSTYGDHYKVVGEKEYRKMPFFWLKEYEIEIQIIEEKREPVQQKEVVKKAPTMVEMEDEKRKSILDLLGKHQQDTIPSVEQYKKMENMQEMMNQMMEKMNKAEQQKGFLQGTNEGILLQFYERMIEAEIHEVHAKHFITSLQNQVDKNDWMNKGLVEEKLLDLMAHSLKVSGAFDLETIKTIALIGPTGVGKTTTIAKLAGYMKQQGKKIGLITTDVYRIGATDQLQIYANILDSEMIAVSEPEGLEAAIAKLRYEYKVDNILIDTVGRSPMDAGLIDDVKEYLDIAQPDHVGLVLSSTQKSKDVVKILENFSAVDIGSLLFTKLDETLNHGVILNAVLNGDKHVSYITNGQNVPYDIYLANPQLLANKILNGVDDYGSSIIAT